MHAKPKVLVVDNNEHILERLATDLAAAGYDAETTWSGRDALGRLQSGDFGFLVLDEYLPDLYVGDFLSQLSHFASPPHVVLMRANPKKAMKFPHPRKMAVIDKLHTDQVLQELEARQRLTNQMRITQEGK